MPNTGADAPVEAVAIGILADPEGRLLLSRRREGVPAAGLWEFPGGRVEPGETVAAALARELDEEVGVTPTEWQRLVSLPAATTPGAPMLHFHRISAWRGEPHGREGQPLRWVAPGELAEHPMPPANAAALRALELPPRYGITPQERGERLVAEAEVAAARHGLLQLRAPGLSPPDFRRLALALLSRVHSAGGRLLLNAAPELVEEVGADGIHLPSHRLMAIQERPLPSSYWVAASCHGPKELAQAAAIGCDFAVLGPVAATTSHPGQPGIGWETFAEWAVAARLPVYALGGVGPDDLEHARAAGAIGVAGIGAFWPEAA